MPRPTGRLPFAAAASLLRPRSYSLRPRSSSAAALQEYCYDSYSEDESPGHGPGVQSSLAGSMVAERGVQWLVMGDRGAKKGLYAQRLSDLLRVPYLSMGSLVRQELESRSPLYEQIANGLNERKLIPEGVIFALLSKRLEEGYCRGETGFILEGIPRNRIQAVSLSTQAFCVGFRLMNRASLYGKIQSDDENPFLRKFWTSLLILTWC